MLEGEFGGAERDRTAGLLVANEALSQLSYSPTKDSSILAAEAVCAKTHWEGGEWRRVGSREEKTTDAVVL